MMLNTIIVIMTPVVFMLLFSVSLTSGQQHDDDYVDPTDLFNFDPANVRMIPSRKPNTVSVDTNSFPEDSQDKCEQAGTCGVPHPRESDSDAESESQELKKEFTARKPKNDAADDEKYSKIKQSLESSVALSRQYVNKLVYLLGPNVGTASSPVQINLRMKVSYHDIVKLRKFGEGTSNDIHDVYEILNYMVQFASESLQPESSIYWLEMKTGLSSEVLLHILVIVICILLILTVLSKMTVTLRMLSRLLFVIFSVSVIFNWIELYQKHKASQEKLLMMEKLSDRCPKMDDLSFFSKITTYFSSVFTFQEENCKEYFEAMLVSPLVKASPIEAVSVSIVKTVVTPLGIIGNGIKAFFVALLKDLPGQYQMLVIVILLVLFILLLFFSSGYYLRIFGLISLGPAQNQHAIHGPPQTNQHQIGNGVYRNVLEAPHLQQQNDQVLGLEEHERINNVPPVAQRRNNRAVTGTSHVDVSGLIGHGNRQRLTHDISDNVNQTDCEGTLAAPITATEASQLEVQKTDNRQKCKQESGDGSRQEVATVVSSAAREGKLSDSGQQCKQDSGDGSRQKVATVVSSAAREGNLTDNKQKCKQDSGYGSRQEVATVVSSAAREGNLTDSGQQCKQDGGDCSSLENAKFVKSVALEILQEGNLSDSKQIYKQESGDDGDKYLVVTSVSSSPVANASLTKQDKNLDIKSGKNTNHVANESIDLTCTNNTSEAWDPDIVTTEGIESMSISRNS